MDRFKREKEHLDYLRSCITAKYKKTIRHIKSAEEFRTTNNIITSADTIVRLFSKKELSFQEFCLNELTQYACELDWYDFVKKYLEDCDHQYRFIPMSCLEDKNIAFDLLKEKFENIGNRPILFQIFKEVLLIKFAQQDKEFFERIFEFEKIFNSTANYYDVYYIIQLLGGLVLKNEWLQIIAKKYYHNLPYQRNYFVEWFVQPNNKTYYKILLERYFRNGRRTEKKIAFYHLIKATQGERIVMHYRVLKTIRPAFWNKHHILKMRWFGVQWEIEKRNRKKLFRSIQKFIADKKNDGDKITCILFVSQYLYKTRCFKEIIQLVELIDEKKVVLGHAGYLNWNNLRVYYAVSLLKKNKKKDAKDVFEKIEADQFDWNFREELMGIYEELEGSLV